MEHIVWEFQSKVLKVFENKTRICYSQMRICFLCSFHAIATCIKWTFNQSLLVSQLNMTSRKLWHVLKWSISLVYVLGELLKAISTIDDAKQSKKMFGVGKLDRCMYVKTLMISAIGNFLNLLAKPTNSSLEDMVLPSLKPTKHHLEHSMKWGLYLTSLGIHN